MSKSNLEMLANESNWGERGEHGITWINGDVNPIAAARQVLDGDSETKIVVTDERYRRLLDRKVMAKSMYIFMGENLDRSSEELDRIWELQIPDWAKEKYAQAWDKLLAYIEEVIFD